MENHAASTIRAIDAETDVPRSDMGLVEDCLTGDAGAFDELVRRHKDRVYRVLYRFLGNEQDALEAAQDVFVRAYRSIHGFAGRSKVSTWLYSIALNLGRNRVRDAHRRGRNKSISIEALQAGGTRVCAPEPSPRETAQRRELDALLQRCLDELPELYRLPFVLRVSEGLSYEEIAGLLECPVGTVKSRLNHARHALRDRLRTLGAL